jgi:C-terminal processing protease CtpA/Prc
MDSNDIIKKVIELIKEKGIPKYVKKWKLPKKIPSEFENDNKMVYWINTNITRKYHPHSNLYLNEWSKSYEKKEGHPRKVPDVFWDEKNKIGRLNYYHFLFAYTKKETEQDENKTVKLVRKNIKNWLEKDMKGLIIDLRKHQGGNMWVFIKSLVDILGDTTLLAFTNKKITKKQGWSNNIGNSTKFKTKELKVKIPIAVIFGKKTSSSGEFSAAVFKGRTNSKSFGEKTAGYLSANYPIKINDKYSLFLTAYLTQTVDMEFSKNEYLLPDVKTTKPITEAKKWILKN